MFHTQKASNLGPKIPFFGILIWDFLKLGKTVVIFEISLLEFFKTQMFVQKIENPSI